MKNEGGSKNKGEKERFYQHWQKRKQTLTLSQGFLEAPGLTLLRGCSWMCTAKSPLDWSKAAGQQQLPWASFHPTAENFSEHLGEALR